MRANIGDYAICLDIRNLFFSSLTLNRKYVIKNLKFTSSGRIGYVVEDDLKTVATYASCRFKVIPNYENLCKEIGIK